MTALRSFVLFLVIAAAGIGIASSPARAQERDVPYWATLRYDEVRMRVGPSTEYKIDWVYKRQGLPVKVVRVYEGWRLVQDHEGTQGWIAANQLSPTLGVLIVGEGLADMRAGSSDTTGLRWRAQPGVVGELLRCRDDYCEIDVAGRTGWVEQSRLWGVGAMEPAE